MATRFYRVLLAEHIRCAVALSGHFECIDANRRSNRERRITYFHGCSVAASGPNPVNSKRTGESVRAMPAAWCTASGPVQYDYSPAAAALAEREFITLRPGRDQKNCVFEADAV
jgi:hypothetical protein